MDKSLRILLLEDNPSDAELAQHELETAKVSFTALRVETREQFLKALIGFSPDVILSDYPLHDFNGKEALVIAKEHAPETPFIFVTGPVSAEIAVECMKSGAADYVLKGRLGFLAPAIEAALEAQRTIADRLQAEKALRESEMKFRTLADIVPHAIVIYRDSKLLFTNRMVEAMSGYTREEISSVDYLQLVHPDFRDFIVKRVSARLRGESVPSRYELKILNRGGEERWLDITAGLIEYEGKPAGIATAFDVTERKRTEQELQKLSRAVEQTADIVFITDRNGFIEYVNPAFVETTGYSREEALGKTPRIFKSGEHPASFYERMWNTVLEGLPYRSILINRKKDGTTFFEDKTITPLRAEDGTIMHFVSTGKDVTEQTKAAELLRQSEEKQRLVLSNMHEIVYSIRFEEGDFPTGTVDFVNDPVVDILGFSAEEFRMNPRLWLESLHPEDLAAVRETTERLLTSKKPITRVYRIKHKHTGEYRWMEDQVVPQISVVDNKVIGIFGVARDITERKRAEEIARTYAERLEVLSKQLLQIQENERQSIARELHDEIGQSLTSLKILLEMSTKAKADDARESSQDALVLIDGLIGRVRNLSLDLRPPALDDLGLVPAIRWHLLHRTEKMGIEAHFKAEPEEIHVSGEIKTACFRVAQEALTNVLKHSKPKSVEVQVMKRGANLELAVRDDGTGFDVDSAFRRAAAGESSGLLGMQERVRLAGGTLVIRSEQGRGSEILATFPDAFEPSL